MSCGARDEQGVLFALDEGTEMAELAFRSWEGKQCDGVLLEGGGASAMKFAAEGCFSESSDKFMGV